MARLLERDRELVRVEAALDAANAGEGACLLIEGEAGIGKTALLTRAEERARERGMLVLTARGGELERDHAFGVARQLFERELVMASEDSRQKLLAGAAGLAAPVVGGDAVPGPPGDPSATLHGLYWLLSNMAAAHPIGLVLDDLHWADAPSLRWLVYVIRRLEGLAAAILLAARSAEPGVPGEMLAALRSEPLTAAVRPEPLSGSAVDTLVREAAGEGAAAEFSAACLEVTRGNPFLLGELLRVLAAERIPATAAAAERVREVGPSSVSESVLVRLAALSPAAVELACAAAVLGSGAELGQVAALAEVGEREALETAEALTQAGILAPGPGVEFLHPLVRTAIYADLGEQRRAAAHRRAARVLAERSAAGERVAAHLLQARPEGDAWTVEQLQRAAGEALARTAPEVAVIYLRRALDEPAPQPLRAPLLHMLGAAEAMATDPGALGHLGEALELAEDPAQRAMIAIELGLYLPAVGQVRRGVDVLQGELDRLGGDHRALAALLEASLVNVAQMALSTFATVGEPYERKSAAVAGDNFAERALLAALSWRRATAADGRADALRLAERALAGGRLLEEAPPLSAVHIQVGLGLVVAEHFEAAQVLIDQAFEAAQERGSVFGFGQALWLRANLLYRLGRLEEALEDALRADQVAEQIGWRLPKISGLESLVSTLVELGDVDRAQAELEAAAIAPHELEGDDVIALWARQGRARLRIAQGNLHDGLDDLLELGRRCGEAGRTAPGLFSWRSEAALALLALGRGDEARRLAAEEVDLARSFGAPRALGLALRAQGLVEGGNDALLQEAVDVLAGSPARLAHAHALVELGAALRRRGQKARAREPLGAALELAHRCSARPLEDRALTELRAAGARPRRPVASGPQALTASERRVAQMAVTGRSNPEIAQALFVTRKTVEQHLSNVYAKLGIRGRAELASALEDSGR